ncbi:MAG TPA: hypothetical protein VMF30_08595 [Pirellulales bacterium]|nr:hypothetical protein [Pirellulales bacterium]
MTATSSQSLDESRWDRELLPTAGGELWNGPAPRALRENYHAVDDDAAWRRWKKHLARRRKPGPLAEKFVGRRSPLAWSWPDELGMDLPDASGAFALAATGKRLKRSAAAERWPRAVAAWLDRPGPESGSPAAALEALAWAYDLVPLVEYLPATLWWRLLGRLVAIANQAAGIDLEAQPLANQWLAGELPLVLASQFPELKPCHELLPAGSAALARGIAELLDGEGLPQCRWLAIFRPLLACWTRARTVAGKKAWPAETEIEFAHAVGEAIRLSRADGRQPLSTGTAGDWEPKLIKQGLRLLDDRQLATRARRLLPPAGRPGKAWPKPDVAAAVHGDWAEMAVLQPGWQCGGPKLTLAYSDRSSRLELEFAGRLIFSGEWQFRLEAAGRPVTLDSTWQEVCWVSDEDVDYVEIEARLSDGFRLQRQVMLARKDRVLFLADAVIAPAAPAGGHAPSEPANSSLTFSTQLPLGAGLQFEPAADTREAWLVGRGVRLAVLPLALAEWRVDPRRGELLSENDQLVLRQTQPVRHLYAPLLIDLDRKRARHGVTWRQLTVAEGREVQRPDVAVGFRGQSGPDQWLAYRSLSGVAARSVLGQNLNTEFLFARFQRDGEVSRLVEIE